MKGRRRSWLHEYFHGLGAYRVDYDGNGIIGPADFSRWLLRLGLRLQLRHSRDLPVGPIPEIPIMRRTRLKLLAHVTLALLTAGVARAQVPSPSNSTIPAMIPVVGFDGNGVPDPIGEVTVIHRDLANNPIAGALVALDFGGCTELRLCADPHDPAATVNCSNRTLSKTTDANGVARFRVVGWSVGTPGTAGAPYNAARVYADGILLGSPSVCIYDLSGANGLSPADLSAWLDDFFGGAAPARGDYDGTGTPLGPSDLSMWLAAFFASGSILNGPPGPCP